MGDLVDESDGVGVVSPALMQDLIAWSLDTVGDSRKKSVDDMMQNMLSACERYELARGLRSGATLTRPDLFGGMLEKVAKEENHPASVPKHMTALVHWFDRNLNGGIQRNMKSFADNPILISKAQCLVAALYKGKNPGDVIPWNIVQAAYRLIATSKSNDRIKARTEVATDLMMLGGLRVGETSGHGSGHGVSAPGIRVRPMQMESVDWAPAGEEGDESTFHCVEVMMEDYKFHNHSGEVAIASPVKSAERSDGDTEGWGLNLYRSLKRLCKAFNMSWKYTVYEGVRVLTINYYVIRIDVSSVARRSAAGQVLFECIQEGIMLLPEAEVPEAYTLLTTLLESRWGMKNKRDQFANVCGGTLEELDFVYDMFICNVQLAIAKYRQRHPSVMSFEAWEALGDTDLPISVKGGPLLRSTRGSYDTHMPAASSTTASDVVKYLRAAEEVITSKKTLTIVSHSSRHTCTARARMLIIFTEVPSNVVDELIDGHFRWEPDMGKMRKDYTGLLQLEWRLAVTMYM